MKNDVPYPTELRILEPTGPYYGDPLIAPLVNVMLRMAAYSLGRFDATGQGHLGENRWFNVLLNFQK